MRRKRSSIRKTELLPGLQALLGILSVFLFIPESDAAPFAYISSDNTASVAVIDVADYSTAATVPVGNNPSGIGVHPDGTRVYVANYTDGTVSVIETARNSVLKTIPVGSNAWPLVISKDGMRVYVGHGLWENNQVTVINTTTDTVEKSLSVSGTIHGIAINSDGTRLYAAQRDGQSLYVIDTANGNVTMMDGATPVCRTLWGWRCILIIRRYTQSAWITVRCMFSTQRTTRS